MTLDARRTYDVWMRLIQDESLYEATIAGNHRELAQSRDLAPEELAILDEFWRLPGTRWNIENLRFRAAAEAAASLVSFLPLTVRLLTGGEPNWLQEIAFEYLAHYHWDELGHQRLSECARFAEYLKMRILKRRIPPPHIETVLQYELAVIDLLKKTVTLPPSAWDPPLALAEDELQRRRLRVAPATKIVDLPVNVLEWIRSGDPPREGKVIEEPLTLLLVIPDARQTFRVYRLKEAARSLFGRFSGDKTTSEVARELGFPSEQVTRYVQRWLNDRALVAAS